ncbi:phosphoglycolate phosphatase [Bartonella apis]|uniref:phosphoglycolate phosphatase n=1 Tax=Bartonella apis TaxID=1686310 RepID=UPI0024313806|nr:phosphoglycolate phosphatase [Bartonella apis]MCT6824259.1 phosphoglycolate phosphatase [Bartonella apis]MCT6860003.1 phosphoglycolate phosphatase [Bartonella apis]MCT6886285.1 phosphoglycolate phosphatase [Bartonella apis]
MSISPIIIFDLDGTLVDSAPDLLDSLNFSLKQDGLKTFTPDDIRRLVGMGGRIMIERALTFQKIKPDNAHVEKLLGTFLRHYEENMPGKTQFFDGVDLALDKLSEAGYKLAVCTNKHEKLARHLLEGMGEASRFITIVGGDTFAYHKPDARHILSTIERACCTPDRALMVGDSQADILAAQSADIPVIAVDFGYTDKPVSAFNPTKIISHFNELTPDLVAKYIN